MEQNIYFYFLKICKIRENSTPISVIFCLVFFSLYISLHPPAKGRLVQPNRKRKRRGDNEAKKRDNLHELPYIKLVKSY